MRGISRFPLLAAVAFAVACSDGHMPTGIDPISPPLQPEVAFSEGTSGGGLEATAKVWTDKDDYQPGDIATVYGSGWASGETVHLHITEDPEMHEPHDLVAEADADGSFELIALWINENHLDVTFTLTATGQSSGMVATWVFTDSNPLAPTVTDQTPNPVAPGSSAQYTVSILFDGNDQECTVELTTGITSTPAWPPAPPGGFFSYEDAELTGIGGDTKTTTLTVNVPAGTAPDTYRFVVFSMHKSGTCNGSSSRNSGQIDLVVGDPTPVDVTAPTVTINQAATQTDPTNSSPINFTVVFSEPVSGFDAGDVELSGTAGATTAVVTVTDDKYNVAVSGMTNDGTVIATVKAGAATDEAGNASDASTSTDNTVTYDATPPDVTIDQAGGQADPTNTSPINFTVIFTELVTGFDGDDIELTGTAGATTAVVTVNGDTYNVAVSGMTNDGTVIATVKAGAATDAAGNASNASTSTDNSVTYDTTRPEVTIDQAATQADPTNTSPINFAVVFSEPVLGFTSDDITLGGTAGATTAGITGTGPSYTVAVSGMSSDGTVTASIAAGVVTDAAGNVNNASTSTDNTVIYDATPPQVSNVVATPNPVAVGSATTLSATIADATTNVQKAYYTIDGGTTWTQFAFSAASPVEVSVDLDLATGVYDICVKGEDEAGNKSDPFADDQDAEDDCVLLAVYDPSAGFVTGGGWIDSPEGAAPEHPDAVGKATFGFVSKYQKGANKPDGNTQFQSKAGDINFHSTSYEWLVVAGARAQYKGAGRLNGEDGYSFLLTAIDGQVNGTGLDRYRMKIIDGMGQLVYDNQIGHDDTGDASTALGGGSIVIHTGGNGGGNKK